MVDQQASHMVIAAIGNAQPDHLGRSAAQNGQVVEITVTCDDDMPVKGGEGANISIRCPLQADKADVGGFGIVRKQQRNEPPREIFIQQQLQAAIRAL